MKPIRTLIPIVLIASLAAANPAQAESGSRTVSYGDLDLTSPAGQAALDRRLASAVREVCGRPYPLDLQSVDQVSRCRRDTRADIQAQRNDAFAQAQNNRIQLSARR
jgi:UrcA family protein